MQNLQEQGRLKRQLNYGSEVAPELSLELKQLERKMLEKIVIEDETSGSALDNFEIDNVNDRDSVALIEAGSDGLFSNENVNETNKDFVSVDDQLASEPKPKLLIEIIQEAENETNESSIANGNVEIVTDFEPDIHAMDTGSAWRAEDLSFDYVCDEKPVRLAWQPESLTFDNDCEQVVKDDLSKQSTLVDFDGPQNGHQETNKKQDTQDTQETATEPAKWAQTRT
jgi:hypothetical protein